MTNEQTISTHGSPSEASARDNTEASFVVRTAHSARTLVRTAHSWILFWTTAL